ncbi:hypothetical protein CQW23_07078 [Capsicum baccatum]|uniref:PLAT domain-containing protein n=1 Tax=Capsicum baccatum TaxID=33114 RepID=A0A2G2X556_CAPBA|nr:hypothetical protein CQW23_07078 [Capsicum baccatum]
MKVHSLRMSEFYHMSLTVATDDPSWGIVYFYYNSWVSPANNYDYHRIFFVNQELESQSLRNGTGFMTMMFKMILEILTVHLLPDQSLEDSKSILIQEVEKLEDLHPRLVINLSLFHVLAILLLIFILFDLIFTALEDPKSESLLPQIESFDFFPLKLKEVLSNTQKSMGQLFTLQLSAIGDVTLNEFNNFEDVLQC